MQELSYCNVTGFDLYFIGKRISQEVLDNRMIADCMTGMQYKEWRNYDVQYWHE
ncbi:hypothetical protein SAMN05660299_02193 [Megasphaera paucivorans]|uniref:Uncharacterized protein n=1 Tax=Megasphaera paucivorans TaxID=349095 RepID=A0A1G9YYT0_9FIRM|nr:hypothetical protein SAMN05660299_02193 [Megasphaera paucivorans]